MTINELKAYRRICAELSDIESELSELEVTDCVQSASTPPYSVRSVPVSGLPPDGRVISLLRRRDVLKRRTAAVERFVEGIEDYQTKKMIYLRYIKGLSWGRVAHMTHNTADSCRMSVKRFLQKS